MTIPMLCCSPDFTHPDAAFRQRQIEQQKGWIDMTCAELGGQLLPRAQRAAPAGVVARRRIALRGREHHGLHAARGGERGVTLIIENHYKDDYWEYPEFAQKMDVFCDLVGAIDSPHFGVNYDPSNAYLAGDDPIELLRRVKHRVVTMHASDRYLAEGTMEDLRAKKARVGYAKRLRHGEIGKGLNDYDAIFTELNSVGFDGWISIEDGVDGMEQLQRAWRFCSGRLRSTGAKPQA